MKEGTGSQVEETVCKGLIGGNEFLCASLSPFLCSCPCSFSLRSFSFFLCTFSLCSVLSLYSLITCLLIIDISPTSPLYSWNLLLFVSFSLCLSLFLSLPSLSPLSLFTLSLSLSTALSFPSLLSFSSLLSISPLSPSKFLSLSSI